MEVVPQELGLRYEKLRASDTDGVDGCAICQEALVNDPGAPGDPDATEAPPAGPGPTVAFPCAGKHLLHAQCLLACLERNTTCPSCGFDIDPGLRVQMLKHQPLRALQSPQVESMPESRGSEVDTNKSLVRDPSPHVGDSDIDFERDFAPWFNPSNC
ncbi:hypothetical protein GSI_02668 [Ganoderma sinense ZZ0214-1]|uniref:RING-type domain-containing protein n=1 Tax=Ganoderma sinense ZZ0214-1 TaxID=1077348 RepID=A0A2G8SM97_9APHY|nr:hypothetical protein GSI_02668 [Ganoderma sinense ZZ0214-1]